MEQEVIDNKRRAEEKRQQNESMEDRSRLERQTLAKSRIITQA